MEKDSKSPGDETLKPIDETPKPLPPKVVTADVSIAAVSMVEDCPDAAAEAESAAAEMIPEARAKRPASDMPAEVAYPQPCQQSFMQISITGQGESTFKFSVAKVRVLDSAGTKLGTVKTRMPSIWESAGYAAWDETVMPNAPVKASYKVSLPTWDDGSKRAVIDFGATYFLEADVMVNGVSKTIRSTLVAPEPAGLIQT